MAENKINNTFSSKSKKPDCRVVAVIPAYNEDRFIGSVVLKTKEYVRDVIVVDDGSSDDTSKIAEAAGAIVVTHNDNGGKGVALNTGLRKARELNPSAVVVLDADGQHDPAEIPIVTRIVLDPHGCEQSCSWYQKFYVSNSELEDLEKADIVIGSRYIENNSQVPKHRVWGHRVFNWITKLSSGTESSDSQSGFRAFSPKAINSLAFSSNGFSVESEMQVLAHELDLKVAEAPITVTYNEKPKRNVFQHGLIVIGGLIRLVGQYRPLLFFGLPGFFFILGGIAMGAYVIERYNQVHELAVGYAMVSVLLSIIGMVSFSTGITLHSIQGLLNATLRKTNDSDDK